LLRRYFTCSIVVIIVILTKSTEQQQTQADQPNVGLLGEE